MLAFLARSRSKEAERPDVIDAPQREREPRFQLHGLEARLLFGHETYTIRLKNLSCGGVCGVTDAPIARCEVVEFEFEPGTWMGAQVRWVRNTTVGFSFVTPLTRQQVAKLSGRLDARRIGA